MEKANKYGIVLKDLISLVDEEILSWSKGVNIRLLFFRYEKFHIKLELGGDINGLNLEALRRDFQQYVGFNTLFTAHLKAIEDLMPLAEVRERGRPIRFNAKFSIEDFILDGRPVTCVETTGEAHLEVLALTVPMHLAYGNPNQPGSERDVFIQQYNLGQTRVIHHGEDISITLDLSKLELPPYWQFRYVEVDGGGWHNHESFQLISPERINMKMDAIDLSITKSAS